MNDQTRTQQAREAWNRDPADELAMAMATSAYLSHFSPETRGEAETTDDEADIAFEAVLLEQGVICPDDVVERLTAIYEDHRTVEVELATGEIFNIRPDGTVIPA